MDMGWQTKARLRVRDAISEGMLESKFFSIEQTSCNMFKNVYIDI